MATPAWTERPIAFYAPWDPTSVASLRDHGGDLSVVVPAWFSVTGANHQITVTADPAGHAALAGLSHHPKLWLMAQNALLGSWDGAGAAALLRDPAASAVMLASLEAETLKEGASGIVIDFEALPDGSQPDLMRFLGQAHAIARKHGWTLSATAPVADLAWDLAMIGAVTDRVILMAYDEHWQTGQPGPIASDPWFRSVVTRAVAQLPRGHAIVGVASYAYDWPATGAATILSITQAQQLAAEHRGPLSVDAATGATHFNYAIDGAARQVWLADAATVRRQTALAKKVRASGIALWRLGTEDQAIWADRP